MHKTVGVHYTLEYIIHGKILYIYFWEVFQEIGNINFLKEREFKGDFHLQFLVPCKLIC